MKITNGGAPIIRSLILAFSLLSFATGRADDQISIELKDETAYGSGGSISDDLYYPGGVPDVGLFVGNPNTQSRNDRALFKYDITPLLLKANKVKRAELIFSVDYYCSEEPNLEVEIERFKDSLDSLGGPELNQSDLETVGIVDVTADDAINGSGGMRNVLEKRLDVTEALKADLKDGLTTSTFRLKIPSIESKVNVYSMNGILIAKEEAKLPVLQITLEK